MPCSSENFLRLNDQLDCNLNLFDGVNLNKTNYFDIGGVIKQLKSLHQNSFSIFPLNIRSINKKIVTMFRLSKLLKG